MIPQDYPQQILLSAVQTPYLQSGWSTETLSNAYYLGGRVTSGGVQNSRRQHKIPLAVGTYTFDLFHDTGANRGIYTLKVDGVAVGTIDGYAASGANAVHSTITGISIAGNGVHLVELIMATKNASSTGYVGSIAALGLTRTA